MRHDALELSKDASIIKNYYKDILEPLKEFIVESEEKFANEGNDKLKERYRCLRTYLEKYIVDWLT